ncbi:hypothetical protein F2Q69_00049356 [Brassica cretica]|uniref:Uncharacterized protein n=1 Tax=Brassica cretica TaxID=69181 RepID=A0A8S9PW28_BRACR|nr:hypothetical protein F2Q69_00049356 [Brassica cretica]
MVAAVASACSVWEAFQALCDVVYNPGLLVLHRRRHENSRHPRKRGEPHLPVTIVEGENGIRFLMIPKTSSGMCRV